ncbi:unnamed protein product [Candidula unifasciata]|uniref:Uncharacterized protein n=1 Tax=Candidula unifasciata TaxID=100452 RepID=A0A8S3ZDF6_9EUPU|nr:unnamed protein product [Candidula unifasciata]
MKPLASTVHHPSLRLPRKICGLFDSGFAGGILDVTSMDSDASAALSGNPFSPGGPNSADAAFFDSVVYGDDVAEALFNSLPPHLISSLGAPEDSLNAPKEHFVTDLPATDSLDAFLNLDVMLDQDLTFDGTTDINLLNANPLFEKTVYSLLGLESFSSKQPAFPDLYGQETTAADISG